MHFGYTNVMSNVHRFRVINFQKDKNETLTLYFHVVINFFQENPIHAFSNCLYCFS